MQKVNVRFHVGKLEKARHQLTARNLKMALVEHIEDPHRGVGIPDKLKESEIFRHNRLACRNLF